MGRVFVVEYDFDELKAVCCICRTHIALLQNLTTDHNYFWPSSDGCIFSAAVNLVDCGGQGSSVDDDLEFCVRVYCVKCGSFLGYRQYPVHNSPFEPALTFIFRNMMIRLAGNQVVDMP